MQKAITLLIISSLMFIAASNSQANNLSAVNVGTCKKLAGTDKPFILVLKRKENVMHSIIRCATDAHITSAFLSGLGALESPTLGYYNLKEKRYQYKTFSGIYELIGLNGNLTQVDNQPFAHVHVTLGDSHYAVIGGHLKNASVGATTEILFIPFVNPIHRELDGEIGLQLISGEVR